MSTYEQLKTEYTENKLISWNGENLIKDLGNYKLYHWQDCVFRFNNKLWTKNLSVRVTIEDGVESAELTENDAVFFNEPFAGFLSASYSDLNTKVSDGTIKNYTRVSIPGPTMIGYVEFVKPNDSMAYYCYNSGSGGFEVTEVSPVSSSFWDPDEPEE